MIQHRSTFLTSTHTRQEMRGRYQKPPLRERLLRTLKEQRHRTIRRAQPIMLSKPFTHSIRRIHIIHTLQHLRDIRGHMGGIQERQEFEGRVDLMGGKVTHDHGKRTLWSDDVRQHSIRHCTQQGRPCLHHERTIHVCHIEIIQQLKELDSLELTNHPSPCSGRGGKGEQLAKEEERRTIRRGHTHQPLIHRHHHGNHRLEQLSSPRLVRKEHAKKLMGILLGTGIQHGREREIGGDDRFDIQDDAMRVRKRLKRLMQQRENTNGRREIGIVAHQACERVIDVRRMQQVGRKEREKGMDNAMVHRSIK